MSSFETAVPALTGDFKYCFIHADESKAVEELIASRSGGLQEDALRVHAERKFSSADLNKNR